MIEVTNQDMETKTFFQPIVQARDNAHVYIGTQEIFQALHHEKIDEMVILEKDG